MLAEIGEERARQDAKWGEQNHPSFRLDLIEQLARRGADMTRITAAEAHASYLGVPLAPHAKAHCDAEHRTGHGTYASILVEEVAEAIECAGAADATELRTELLQVAAVCVAWIEALDRRGGKL